VRTDSIIEPDDVVLVTGATGFLGPRLVQTLAEYGVSRIRCFVRPSSNVAPFHDVERRFDRLKLDIVRGNLLNPDDCRRAADGVSVVYHLAAGTAEKSYAGAFLNSVVTTRNLLDALRQQARLKRFVNVSSFSVYSGTELGAGAVLDENCAIESEPQLRYEAYCFGKLKQDEIVAEYGRQYGMPYVIMRPSVIYGPGRSGLTGRVGIDPGGLYLHLGGSNLIPITYVDNCADAIALAGFAPGIDGQVFNIVDDDLPRARTLLRLYKKNVKSFFSVYIPHPVGRFLSAMWENYSNWSRGQLPPAFNRRRWATYWQGNRYSNHKLKTVLGWRPKVSTDVALTRFFDYCREVEAKCSR
jgi:nucleoside-diphosphate-sugar epimerase